MTASNKQDMVDWEVCEHCEKAGGIGVRLPGGTRCWAHSDDHSLAKALKRLGEGEQIDARGVSITAELLERILAMAPRDPELPDRPLLHSPRFDHATFGDKAWFYNASFGNEARFVGATFGNRAWFGDATFGNNARFDRTAFGDRAGFDSATFGNEARFHDATFGNQTRFGDATFGNNALFIGTSFGADASFSGATFGDDAWFGGVTFGNDVWFDRVTFGDNAQFGPILAAGGLWLERASFGQSPVLAVSAEHIRCRQARFPHGGRLQFRWAEIALDGASFGRPSVLEAAWPFEGSKIGDESALIERIRTNGQSYRTERPRPVCLAGADVQNLVLAGCDLRACRFTGAHNLTALRLESTIVLPATPRGWQQGRALPPLWRWGRRETVAEEHHWRQQQPKSAGWRGASASENSPYLADWHADSERVAATTAAEVAAVYRALRKGREDNKDEPGAADFYYGEMEMRRHDKAKPKAERAVVFLYWLVSGYALRASRAVSWLLGVLIVATVLLAAVGLEPPASTTRLEATITGTPPSQTMHFDPPTSPSVDRPFTARLGTAALVAVEGAVFRASDQALTYTGRLIQAVLRFVGPILLGLAVFSIRGRVKR
jgi:hypothetical protein